MSKKSLFKLGIMGLAGGFFLFGSHWASASVQDEINSRNKQIEELSQQIQVFQEEIDSRQKTSQSLSNEIGILNARINQIQSEIKSLSLSISQTGLEINQTEGQVKEAEGKIQKHLLALGSFLRLMDQNEQKNLLEILFEHKNFAEFFGYLDQIQITQENIRVTVNQVKDLKKDLEQKDEKLQEQKRELQSLQDIQKIQRRSVEGVRTDKKELLKTTKGEESRFQQLVKQSQANVEKIRAQIFYLQQNGVSAEEAVKFGQLAAIGQGIRPAFLLAILEIESGLGKNVGTGNWLDDMYKCYLRLGKPRRAEEEKNAFLAIVGKLGLDPNSVRVSREPNYGCGGALGPAQFLPTTWLAYEERVAGITGHHPPNPWNVEDAFTASAIKLANAGATDQSRNSEKRAAKAYLSGNPSCSSKICNYYATAVLNKAEDIGKSL